MKNNAINESIPIKLFYKFETSEERVVVSFPRGYGGRPLFDEKDKYLEEAMKVVGIPIPLQQRDQYPEFSQSPNRQAIYLEDASFGKAFYHIYFPQKMNPVSFTWKKI